MTRNTQEVGSEHKASPWVFLGLLLILLTIVFLSSVFNGDKPNEAVPTLAFYNQVVAETQQAKRDYAQKHGIPVSGNLSPAQLADVIDQFEYPRDQAGNFLYAGGRAIKINPKIDALPDLVTAQVEETDPCEILISEIHRQVKDYAEIHGIAMDATLSVSQIREISDAIDLPKNEFGEFICSGKETIAINSIVNQRPGRVNRILFDLGGGKP